MIEKYILRILRYDQSLAPFVYVGSERRILSAFPLSDGRRVRLKGYIDRLDEVDRSLRIVDYKTGTEKKMQFATPADLFDRDKGMNRQSAVMQVLIYAWMLHAENLTRSLPLRPSIYYVRSLFKDTFDPSIYTKEEGQRTYSLLVDDFVGQCLPDFEIAMRHVLDELFDPRIPFIQTNEEKSCGYCTFRELCGRKKAVS